MTGSLRVLARELDETANRQRDLSEGFGAAERVTDGATQRVAFSHGLVCGAAVAALGSAQTSRAAATKAVQSVADHLADNLGTASKDYSTTDQQKQAELGRQVPPR